MSTFSDPSIKDNILLALLLLLEELDQADLKPYICTVLLKIKLSEKTNHV